MYKKIYSNIRALVIFTLAITSLLFVTAYFALYSSSYKDELKNEALLIKKYLDDGGEVKNISDTVLEKRITLVESSGKILYDNGSHDISGMDNHINRPEIALAIKDGEGYAERYSKTLNKAVYYYAVKLKDGNVVRVCGSANVMFKMFATLCIPIVIVVIFLYFLINTFAKNLTKSIVVPINEIDIKNEKYESDYDELMPFLNRIKAQSDEIKAQMEKIRNQKIRLSTLSDNMNEGLIVLDKNKTVISINISAQNIFEKNDALNSSFLYLTRDDAVLDNLKKAYSGEKRSFETVIKDKNYQIFISPVFEKSVVTSVIILIFDIDEKAKAEKVRREFSANVSHELKTPLTTILGYSQIIKNGIAKNDDIIGFSEKIEKEAERLLALINDIIELSKLDEENGVLNAENVNLKETAQNVCTHIKEKAEKKNVNIDISGNDLCVKGNKTQLYEMIFNIVDNAVKYNKENGKVNIVLGEDFIRISDTGIGIGSEDIKRIFERFYRADKSRSKKAGGTGLGLSIAKHIAMCHNADIKAESEINKGSMFTVTFKKEDIISF